MTEDFGDNEVGNAHIAQAVENCESDNGSGVVVVRWKDRYLRVMKPSKGPGRAGIAPNRRWPSFFVSGAVVVGPPRAVAAGDHLPGADNVYRISSGHPRPLRPIEGAAPSSGG